MKHEILRGNRERKVTRKVGVVGAAQQSCSLYERTHASVGDINYLESVRETRAAIYRGTVHFLPYEAIFVTGGAPQLRN